MLTTALDDLQAGRAAAGRPRRYPVPLPPRTSPTTTPTPKRSSRRSRPACVPRPVRLDPGPRQGTTARISSPGTTTSTAIAGWACTPPPTSTTAGPQPSRPDAPRSWPLPTTPTPSASSRKPQPCRNCQAHPGSTRPRKKKPPLSKSRPHGAPEQVDRFRSRGGEPGEPAVTCLSGRPPAARGYQCGSKCHTDTRLLPCPKGTTVTVTGLRRMPVDIAVNSVCSLG